MFRKKTAGFVLLGLLVTGCAGPATTMPPGSPNSSYNNPLALPGYDSANPAPSATSAPQEQLTKDNFFRDYGVNPFVKATQDNLSTFGLDVDTASYTWMRKSVGNGILPTRDSIRAEEYINYFDYNYPQPEQGKFSISMDLTQSPFTSDSKSAKLLRIGIQGKDIDIAERKDAVLTFVIDVSGSMDSENRLGLVKQTLELLLKQLRSNDKVGIVIYGSNASVVLEHTSISNESAILKAINSLTSEGSTNAEEGLRLGYKLAEKAFKAGAINRVILCSDGVANVGNTGPEQILEMIKHESESGITLSAIGFGMGNYNDILMEQLADKGDGNYSYVDTLNEAYRVFVENLSGTLQVIAKDAKVQVEFNKDTVQEYRLIGYENRAIADNDFRNDKVDGGEVGAGHSVTALYELKLNDNAADGKIAVVNLRYKDVDDMNSIVEINKEINLNSIVPDFNNAPDSLKLAASAALYAELLKESPYVTELTMDNVLTMVKALNTYANSPRISEFAGIIQNASQIKK